MMECTHHVVDGTNLVELCDLGDGRFSFFGRLRDGSIRSSGGLGDGSATLQPLVDDLTRQRHVKLPPVPHNEVQDGGALFRDLLEFIPRYVTWSRPFLIGATAYAMATWVYERFDFFPYLQFVGAHGSGKTRSLDVLAGICYHGTRLSSVTSAVLYRVVSKYHPTLLIDEVDSEIRSDLRSILRAGTSRQGSVMRCDGKDYKPRSFPCYGPKVYGGQEPILDPALASRFIQENMALLTPERHIGPTLPDAFYMEGPALQARLVRWSLDNFGSLQLSDPPGNDLRQRQVFLPLFTVTPTEFHGALCDLVRRQAVATRTATLDTLDGEVVAGLREMDATEIARPQELAMMICARRGVAFEDTRNPEHVSAAKVGHVLKRLGIVDRRRDASGIFYRVGSDLCRRLYRMYLPELPIKRSESTEVNACQPNPEETTPESTTAEPEEAA